MTWFEWCVIRHWLYREAVEPLKWYEKVWLWYLSYRMTRNYVALAEHRFPQRTRTEQRNWAVAEMILDVVFGEEEEDWQW